MYCRFHPWWLMKLCVVSSVKGYGRWTHPTRWEWQHVVHSQPALQLMTLNVHACIGGVCCFAAGRVCTPDHWWVCCVAAGRVCPPATSSMAGGKNWAGGREQRVWRLSWDWDRLLSWHTGSCRYWSRTWRLWGSAWKNFCWMHSHRWQCRHWLPIHRTPITVFHLVLTSASCVVLRADCVAVRKEATQGPVEGFSHMPPDAAALFHVLLRDQQCRKSGNVCSWTASNSGRL